VKIRQPQLKLSSNVWYPVETDGKPSREIQSIKTGWSGCYALRRRKDGHVWYVGSSATGSARKRLLRHLQAGGAFKGWTIGEAGAARKGVDFKFKKTSPGAAARAEAEWTQRLRPSEAQMVFVAGYGWITRARAEKEDAPF
jgi:hypothetical protein